MELVKIDSNFKDMEKLYILNDESFPKEERIPSNNLIEFLEEMQCKTFGIYNECEFIVFITLLQNKEQKIAYLWFLAIDSRYKSKGFGSKALESLNELYKEYQIIVDIEKIDKDSENNEQRERRLTFYIKNGYKRSNYGMNYFGVDYETLYNKWSFDKSNFQKLLKKIKVDGFTPQIYMINEK